MPKHQVPNPATPAIRKRPSSDRPALSRPAHPAAFRALAWSNLAAQSAEQIALSATPLVAVLALGAGAGATGLLAAAQTLPFLLLSLPAGLVADRTSRKLLMVTAEALRAATLLALVLLTALGLLSMPLLAVLGFLAATGTVAFSVAAPALVPALVPREGLARANGLLELARSAAFAAGPALGGIVVGWAGASPAFVVAAILSAIAVLSSSACPSRRACRRGVISCRTCRRAPASYGAIACCARSCCVPSAGTSHG